MAILRNDNSLTDIGYDIAIKGGLDWQRAEKFGGLVPSIALGLAFERLRSGKPPGNSVIRMMLTIYALYAAVLSDVKWAEKGRLLVIYGEYHLK